MSGELADSSVDWRSDTRHLRMIIVKFVAEVVVYTQKRRE